MNDSQITQLIDAAAVASARAYTPYSHYNVGAALLGKDGQIYGGCNVENASYPATICAERTALVKAVSEGQREFEAIVVMTRNAGSPCGICRQMLYEFAPNLRVILVDEHKHIHFDGTLSDLLPLGFNGASLEA